MANGITGRRFSRVVIVGACVALALACIMACILAPQAFGASGGEGSEDVLSAQAGEGIWEAPQAPSDTGDGVVTVGSHLSATATAEMLGLNGTVFPGQPSYSMAAANLAEASTLERLGVFGTKANVNPNPYLANLFYDYYASENDLPKSSEAAVVDTQVKSDAYVFYVTENPEYGTTSELAMRPDIVMGVSNATGQAYSLTMNYATTTAVNHTTWGSGASTPSQPYMCVLNLRRHTADPDKVGTRNSDGNVYETSEFYKDGDESYDPIAVVYNRGSNGSGIDYAVENANALAWAAKRAMQQDGTKTARYGDPLAIANDYERYAKGIKWGILAKQAKGELTKKTVAVVARVIDGKFKLVKMNPDGNGATGFHVAEAAQDTVVDLAGTLYPNASVDVVKGEVTPQQLMQADVVICMPPMVSSYKSSAVDVSEALAAAGYEQGCEGYPEIFDNVVAPGTFQTVGGLYDSCESALLVGQVQGFIYPEVLDGADAVTYYASKLFHLSDDAVSPFVARQLAGGSLASGALPANAQDVASAVASVQELIDEGVAYYYEQGGKQAIDAARPRIASSDALDDAYGVGVSAVSLEVPEGATFELVDAHGLIVSQNADGTYTIDDDDETTLNVRCPGYRNYSVSVKGGAGAIRVTAADMTATKKLVFALPEGATVAWVKNAKNLVVAANEDGSYTLDDGALASYCVTLAGYDDLLGHVAPDQAAVDLTEQDFTPCSTATSISVPMDASLVVTDAQGAGVAAQADGTYRLFDGGVYTLTVTHPRYQDYVTQIVGGESAKVAVRLAQMTALVGKTELVLDKATVTSADISAIDAETVQSITLGPSVKKVAAKAFCACTNLRTVSFGAKVTTVGDSAFAGCAKLVKVTLGKKVATIGKSAFWGCSSLSSLALPAGVKSVKASAFSGCKKLKTLTVKTQKLAKSKVKNALKGSSVKTVKVSVGKTAANKKYVKKYKKIFTKAICGKKATVKR